jgi:ribonuclease VapC
MIVIDTSALLAIMGDEPERRAFNERIESAAGVSISAASLLEARIVLFARSGENAVLALDAFLLKSRIAVVEVSPRVGDIAFDAYRRYGRGTGHPAALNYGDCFSYALARQMDAPLLYKGNDFAQTDIRPAVAAIPAMLPMD